MQHERIVQYFGFDRGDDYLCIFMEYMAGGSIKDVIRQWGPLSNKLTAKYTKQILQGLVYLHHYEIVSLCSNMWMIIYRRYIAILNRRTYYAIRKVM